MSQPVNNIDLSYTEYLALEQETDVRHEFLDGDAWAMAGGTLRHAALKTNLTIAVGMALRGKPCRAFDSDAKIRVEATGLSTYPDLAIICGPAVRSALDPHAATNPTVLFEVLSRGTESWDRGGKFQHYRHLDSLRHYVLLSTEEAKVEVYTRSHDGIWQMADCGQEDAIVLSAVDLSLPVKELYVDLPDAVEADRGARPSPR